MDDGWDGNHGNPKWYPFHLEIPKTKALSKLSWGKKTVALFGGVLAYLDSHADGKSWLKWNEGIDFWWWLQIFVIFTSIWGFPKVVVPNNHGFSY